MPAFYGPRIKIESTQHKSAAHQIKGQPVRVLKFSRKRKQVNRKSQLRVTFNLVLEILCWKSELTIIPICENFVLTDGNRDEQ